MAPAAQVDWRFAVRDADANGGCHAWNDSAYRAHIDSAQRRANVALQPTVGIRSKWAGWPFACNCGGVAFAGAIVTKASVAQRVPSRQNRAMPDRSRFQTKRDWKLRDVAMAREMPKSILKNKAARGLSNSGRVCEKVSSD
jgi:hypothetical protein